MPFNRMASRDNQQRGALASSKLPFKVTEVMTAAYRARYGDCVLCDPSGGGFTVSLPSAAKVNEWVAIKNTTTSANTITLDADGSDTVEGAGTFAMSVSRLAIVLIADGRGGWWAL